MKAFTTPVDVTPGTTGSYQTVDLSAHVDAADDGHVVLACFRVRNTSGTEHTYGLRPTGQTFDPGGVIEDNGHTVGWCKVDASNQVDINISNAAVEVHLEGYWVDNEAEAYDSPPDVVPGTADGTYQDVDISSHTTATAKVACLMVAKPGAGGSTAGDEVVLRPNGSTDTAQDGHRIFPGDTRGMCIPVDGSEIFEAAVGNANVPAMYLVGTIHANVTTFTDAKNYDPSASSSYQDLDMSADVPASALAIAFFADQWVGITNDSPVAWRADGETFDWYQDITTCQFGVTPIANQIVEVKITNNDPSAWRVYGYFEVHSDPSGGGATPTAAGGINRGLINGGLINRGLIG